MQGTVGELEVRLKYLPFKATGSSPGAGGHEGGTVDQSQPGQAGAVSSTGATPPRPRSPSSSDKGILTVTLVRAFNLEVSPSWMMGFCKRPEGDCWSSLAGHAPHRTVPGSLSPATHEMHHSSCVNTLENFSTSLYACWVLNMSRLHCSRLLSVRLKGMMELSPMASLQTVSKAYQRVYTAAFRVQLMPGWTQWS